jgi:peroxiredoxin
LGVFGQEEISAIKFSLRSIDGGNITDANVRGKVVVFITTSSRLPVRARQVASFRNLMHDYSPRGVDFYLVSTDPESRKSKRYVSDEQLRQYVGELELPLKVLRDPGGEAMRKYGKNVIPLVFVLDKQGRVDGKPIQGYSQRSVASMLRPQLARLTK